LPIDGDGFDALSDGDEAIALQGADVIQIPGVSEPTARERVLRSDRMLGMSYVARKARWLTIVDREGRRLGAKAIAPCLARKPAVGG
jgi:hypothetical protein